MAKQFLDGIVVRFSGDGQFVVLLVFLEGITRLVTELAVHNAFVALLQLQGTLQLLDVFPGVAVAQIFGGLSQIANGGGFCPFAGADNFVDFFKLPQGAGG